MMNVNGTNFDLEFCSRFSPAKLKSIYNGESAETLNQLIELVHGKQNNENELPSNDSEFEREGVHDFGSKG
jgi:hypothetical protein